jgi:hypothetical protein
VENDRPRPNKARLAAGGAGRRSSAANAGSGRLRPANRSPVSLGDVNQLLGQIEVETKRAAKTRVYGCLLAPATTVKGDAAQAARDKITLINHDAAIRLYNLLARSASAVRRDLRRRQRRGPR